MNLAPASLRAVILTVGRMTYEVPLGKVFRIGRHRTNDLVFNDSETSRFHALIEWKGGRPVIRDQASLNGTFVAGRRIQEATELLPGHRVLLGKLRVDVELLEDVEEAPALLADDSGEIRMFTEWSESELSGRFTQQVTFHRLLLDLEENYRTGTLTLETGVRNAEVVFQRGRIANATFECFHGTAALSRVLAARVGRYRFRPTFEPQEALLDLSPKDVLARGQAGTRKHYRASA